MLSTFRWRGCSWEKRCVSKRSACISPGALPARHDLGGLANRALRRINISTPLPSSCLCLRIRGPAGFSPQHGRVCHVCAGGLRHRRRRGEVISAEAQHHCFQSCAASQHPTFSHIPAQGIRAVKQQQALSHTSLRTSAHARTHMRATSQREVPPRSLTCPLRVSHTSVTYSLHAQQHLRARRHHGGRLPSNGLPPRISDFLGRVFLRELGLDPLRSAHEP